MRRASASTRRRARRLLVPVASLVLLELLASGRAATAADGAGNGTVVATVTTLPPPSCAIDRQLMAGDTSCNSTCNVEGTAACIAFRADPNVCAPGNPAPVTPLCRVTQAKNSCFYQCLPWVETTEMDAFTFHVAPNASANASEWRTGLLWQNQRLVTTIGAMDMPERIKYVTLTGGSSVRNVAKGNVVDVNVSLSLSGASVTNLTLANLNMAAYTAPSVRVSQFPPRIESLSIINCKLSTLPVDMTNLTALTTLDLSQNEIVTFAKTYSMESLQRLSLSNNNLTTLDAIFPALQSLDLSNNKLEAIPGSVFLFPQLKSLDVSGNQLVSSTFTPAQYGFLNNLTSLSISGFSSESVCKPENQHLLRAHLVCVLESTDLVVISKSSLTWYITIPVVATVIVSLVGFSVWYYRRKNYHAKRNGMPTKMTTLSLGEESEEGFRRLGERPGSSGEGATTVKTAGSLHTSKSLWSDEELLACQLRFEDIEDFKQIGMGAFAVVWLVTYRQSRLLASKRLVKDQVSRTKTQVFVAEIKLNAQLDHPSIVKFIGAAWTVESDLQALFEYMANGDLRGYLDATRDDPSRNAWSCLKVQMAIEIAEALVYVHSFTPALVHRDLKSKNVLLNDDMKAKLSDFGVSRFQSENGTMTAGVGTGKWLAPEVLAGDDYNEMCDIYSLGVVLSELDTHAIPYEELQQADVATLQLVLSGQARPRFSDQCPREIRDLADRCLVHDPTMRPSAMEVAFTLRTFAKTLDSV